MSYKRCSRAMSLKLWEHVVFLLKIRTPMCVLQRNLHIAQLNQLFNGRSREHSSKVGLNYHCYHQYHENLLANDNEQHRSNKTNADCNYFKNRNSHFNKHIQNTTNSRRFRNYDLFNGNLHGQRLTFQNKYNDLILKPFDWTSVNLPEIIKDCYVPHADVTSRDTHAVEVYRQANRIAVSGAIVPNPIESFRETNLPHDILKEFQNAGFEKPTPIQAQAWPIIMSGHNLIGIGQTGTGKTIAYIIPSILHINKQVHNNKKGGPAVLILAPTRELSQQISSIAQYFGRASDINSVCVFGGQSPLQQLKRLELHPQICVATPGRLLSFLAENLISLRNCTYLVIDEADRMFDLGFEPQIRQIIQQIRPDRQILLWSASWPKKIAPLVENYIQDPVKIVIGNQTGEPNQDIMQVVDVCKNFEKFERLEKLLANIDVQHRKSAKILIFVNIKKAADILANKLRSIGYNALSLHGDHRQRQRQITMNEFRENRNAVLVATDVVARGVDVPNIDYVINMDCPLDIEQYIHRIGRTGRSGNKGKSYTFMTEMDKALAPNMVDILRQCNQEVNPKLIQIAIESSRHRRR